ncbi:TetR/AcrR family transcriptional regulator [Knoellia sp. p5-6-4]|uniref:TetR/AcrR family transcriptional regulator n=1 Tax=unclassified Knoellia TaxID=2618719 RepID=UPI0023DA9729|nr:TetR/AcrR family transcriptional regulator [Knoellia sp. p5-6-4]MDF2143843.1 TetR/AcrR family transcriptional regulator [Knoellia sp. p5-6-4]
MTDRATDRVTEPSLRDAKRAATARALSEAAFALASERGVDGFTIDDVAARAGYSRRTFANHYSCKEEAVAAVILEVVREGVGQLPDVPADAPLLDWLSGVARQQLSGPMLETIRSVQALAEAHPSLDPWFLEVQRTIRQVALDVVSERAGERYYALYVHLLVGALYGALSAVLDGPFTLRLPGERKQAASLDVDAFLATTFAHLRDGF